MPPETSNDLDDRGETTLPTAAATKLGQRPQYLLLTLLGDYWMSSGSLVPSSALVDLLLEFGVSTAGARAAMSRLSRRGLLSSSRVGRRTYYQLTERARHILMEELDRIASFGAKPDSWDGQWTYVAFSVPEVQRRTRHQLRARLRWLGFAPLYDGLWVSPRALGAEVKAILDELAVASATILVGRELGSGMDFGQSIDAWDLETVHAEYEAFIARMQPIQERLFAGGVSPAEALQVRTRVIDEWRNMPNTDPDLPRELLPSEWPRAEARKIFRSVYDGLGDPAMVRVREVVFAHSPEFADAVNVHTSALWPR